MNLQDNEKLIKLLNVIESCNSTEQFVVAMKYAELCPVEWRELNTVKMAIKRKGKELKSWNCEPK